MGMGRGFGGQNIKVMKITCLRNQHVSAQRKAATGLRAYVRLPPYLETYLLGLQSTVEIKRLSQDC